MSSAERYELPTTDLVHAAHHTIVVVLALVALATALAMLLPKHARIEGAEQAAGADETRDVELEPIAA
jgi:hypothetical protein